MATRLGSSKGAWFNPASGREITRAAKSYDVMADRVEASAKAAAEKHIVAPAAAGYRQAGAHKAADALGVFNEGDEMYVGLPDNHPALPEAQDAEFGGPTSLPGAHLRNALVNNQKAARVSFFQGLLGQ